MAGGFIFGGDTGVQSAAELARRRKLVDALLETGDVMPRTFGEGLSVFGRAIAGKLQDKKLSAKEDAERARVMAEFGGLPGVSGYGSGGGGSGGGTPFVYEPSKPMPKADIGGVSGMGEAGIGFAGTPKADMGVLGATDGLGFTVPGSGDPTLGLIKSFEGFRETPYWDVNALRTGYGSDTVTLPDGTVQKVGEGTRVSQEDADRDLQRRVSTEFAPIAARAVGDDVFAALMPNQKAALTSIAYNYGELPSSVAEAVRSGDPQAAAAAIAALGSHNNGINAGRRSKEAAFYLDGSTGGDPVSMSAMGGPAPAAGFDMGMDIAKLAELAANPYLPEGQRAVVAALMEAEMAKMQPVDPMSAIELEKAQLELDAMKTPKDPEPIKVGDVLLDPMTMQPIFDGRQPDGGTNVTVNNGGQDLPGLSKLGEGMTYLYNPDGTIKLDERGVPMATAVVGGPADTTSADAARASGTAVASDVITTAADRALAANKERALGGLPGALAAYNPSTPNAEVYRQVEVLTANAKVENLQAMRNESKTGGALGSVTEKETQMLADQAGALDPASPNFERDLMDYTRNLLRVIHGDEAGTAIFNEKYGAATTPEADPDADLLLKYGITP